MGAVALPLVRDGGINWICVSLAWSHLACLTRRASFEKRSSYARGGSRLRVAALRRQVDLYAVSDRLGERHFGARHRGFRRVRRADGQDALPVRCMHVGAEPRPTLRRSDGHLKPAMATRPLADHRVTGTKRKLRLGHVSREHTVPPPLAVAPKCRVSGIDAEPTASYPGSAAGNRAASATEPGLRPSQRGAAPQQRVEVRGDEPPSGAST